MVSYKKETAWKYAISWEQYSLRIMNTNNIPVNLVDFKEKESPLYI